MYCIAIKNNNLIQSHFEVTYLLSRIKVPMLLLKCGSIQKRPIGLFYLICVYALA